MILIDMTVDNTDMILTTLMWLQQRWYDFNWYNFDNTDMI